MTLCACGGANTGGGGGGGDTNRAANQSAENRANSAQDGGNNTPSEDPDLYRKVKSTKPAGWLALKTPVKKELERHFKPVSADWKFVSGVVNSEAPGPTEPPEEWGEWEHKAAGAMLYWVSDKSSSPRAAVDAHAKNIAAGVPDVKEGNGVAWTLLQGGEIVVVGISNKLGTYIVVGVVLTTEPDPAREAIRKWAEGIQPE